MQAYSHKSRITLWQLAIVMVCLCVFLFGLHAKLSMYQPDSPSVTLTTAAKLWMGNQKMDIQDGFNLASLAVLIASFFPLFIAVSRPHSSFLLRRVPSPAESTWFYPVRPPPSGSLVRTFSFEFKSIRLGFFIPR